MGGAKRFWEAEQEQGFSSHNAVMVCSDCFEDYGIKEFIKSNAANSTCSYCSSSNTNSCDLDNLIGYLLDCIQTEWGNPASEGLPYESREGGWQYSEVIHTAELIFQLGLETKNQKLLEDIISSIHNTEWCEKDPYSLTPDQTLMFGWQNFSSFVINTARYVFYKAKNATYDEHQHDELNPVDILDALGSIVNSQVLLSTLSTNTNIKRVRIVDPHIKLTSVGELGSPPNEYATVANRMSPAGIPMFYGAFDEETAIKETYQHNPKVQKKAVCGNFKPTRELTVIDLSKAPDIPSLFDQNYYGQRHNIKFINDFITDFSKPIDRTDRAHIDYVPTQIVTEYFRHVLELDDGRSIDGVIYPSSKNEKHTAIVIFAESSQCIDLDDEQNANALLRLESINEVKLS